MYAYCSYLIDRALCYATITDNSKSAVEIIQNFLDTHYAEDIQRNDLSDIVFVSPDHLSRLFKKETGLSLMQYVTKKRITAACSFWRKAVCPSTGWRFRLAMVILLIFPRFSGRSPG